MEIKFLQFSYKSRKQKQAAVLKLCKLVTNVLVNLPFFPRVDFGRLLVCCLGAHSEPFGFIGRSLQLLQGSRSFLRRMTRPV